MDSTRVLRLMGDPTQEAQQTKSPSESSRTQKTKALPIKLRYLEKFRILDGGLLGKEDDVDAITQGEGPRAASVELLNAEEASKFDVNGGLADNSIVSARTPMPDEIIAVVRAKGVESMQQGGQQSPRNYSVLAGPKTIVPQSMVMNLEVKCFDFMPPEVNIPKAAGGGRDKKAKVVYIGSTRASTKRRVKGLYRFNTKGNSLEHLFSQIGTYVFHFSVVGSKYGNVPPAVVRVNVAGDEPYYNRGNSPQYQRRGSRALVRPKESSSRFPPHARTTTLEEELDDEDLAMVAKKDITLVHIATLDELVSVNSFFAVAVFLGLAFSPPIPLLQVVTSLAPQRADCYVNVDVYRGVILYEVLSFGCFLFSTLLAHGFKLFIVLGNGRDMLNAKFVAMNRKFLRFGILSTGLASVLGCLFMVVSMIDLIEVRLGSLTCGNPWALATTIPLVALSVSGFAIFISAVFYESIFDQ